MSHREISIRQSLIRKFLKQKPASFQQLEAYLVRESDLKNYCLYMSPRTFRRDVDDILSIHGELVSYDNVRRVYYLE